MASIPDYSDRVELGVRFAVDQRSISDEAQEPGSVRGRAGRRAREALAAWRASRDGADVVTDDERRIAAHVGVSIDSYLAVRAAQRRGGYR